MLTAASVMMKGFGLEDSAEQFVAMKRPLHDRANFARTGQHCGMRGSFVAVLGVDDVPLSDGKHRLIDRILDPPTRPDQYGIDQPARGRIGGGFHGDGGDGMYDGGGYRRNPAAPRKQMVGRLGHAAGASVRLERAEGMVSVRVIVGDPVQRAWSGEERWAELQGWV